LHHLIADQLLGVIKAAPPPDPAAPAAECPLDAAGVSAALRDAFVATDAELKASGVLDHNSGSTALVALLTPATIWLAWAGGCGLRGCMVVWSSVVFGPCGPGGDLPGAS
jgi:hypothetical protein